jgi:hypothetical protein
LSCTWNRLLNEYGTVLLEYGAGSPVEKIQYLGIFRALENLIAPLDRDYRFELGTELEQFSRRIWC